MRRISNGPASHSVHVALRALCIGLMAAFIAIIGGMANAADLDYGKPGEPVKLVVGYQPYATLTWDGAVQRKKEFWKKYLPAGSTVEFQVGLQGSVIVNQMLAGKQHMGYLGDMPAIVSTTKQDVADLRMVAVIDQDNLCNIVVVRADAPKFKDFKEALQWLNGKQVAAPFGSCADRFARFVMQKENVKPAAYLNQGLEVIATGFRAGKLDGSFQWEPTTAKMVLEGMVRVIAYGDDFDEWDNCYVTMRADLIKQRPDVVKAMLNAELDAQLFMADPKNANELIDIISEQVTGFTKKALWHSLYGTYPDTKYKSDVRMSLPFTFTPDVRAGIDKATAFLHSIKAINVDKLRPEAVMPEFAEQVLKERGLKSPIGAVRAQPDANFRGN